MLYNIFECINCNRRIIAEERSTHKCLEMQGQRIEGDIKWVFDGRSWYPLKLRPTNLKQPDKTTNNDTESFFTIRRNINDIKEMLNEN